MKLSHSLLSLALILILLFIINQAAHRTRTNQSINEVKELYDHSKETANDILRNLTIQQKDTLVNRTSVTNQRVEVEESTSTLNFDYSNSRIYRYTVQYQLNCPIPNADNYDRLTGLIEISDDSSTPTGLSMIKADLLFIGEREDKTLSFIINNRGEKRVFINDIDCTDEMGNFISDTASDYMSISRNLLSQ